MRDVLDFSANEVADALEMTVSAVNSALHRARVTLAKQYHKNGHSVPLAQPDNEVVQPLLDQYLLAWETGDVEKLIGLLKQDGALTMPPSPSWYHGTDSIRTFLETFPFSEGARRQWHLQQVRANAQPAFELYRRDPATGCYRAVGRQVLTLGNARITEITVFLNPEFFSSFGFTR